MTLVTHKAALVSVAGSGIGRATALALAAAGACVAVTDIDRAKAEDTVRLVREASGEAIALRCDASRHQDHVAAVDAAVQAFRALHIACNNADISGGAGGGYRPLADGDPQHWQRMLDINLSGVFHGLRAQIPALLAAAAAASCTSPR